MEDIRDRIEREVGSWEGVTTHEHRFGGVEFRLGKRELGHLHDSWADLPFTSQIATPHKFGVKGWVSRDLDDEVVELFRLSYERAKIAQRVAESDSA
jgi:hypothetical protein